MFENRPAHSRIPKGLQLTEAAPSAQTHRPPRIDMLAPGRLPEKQYYRGATLGNGAYGSVSVVFDEDGNEYAGKTFYEENDDGDGEWDDDGEWDEGSGWGLTVAFFARLPCCAF